MKVTEQGALTAWRQQREGHSGHRKKAARQGPLTDWRWQRESQSGHRKKVTEQGALTDWRRHREGQIRIWKENKWERSTHSLETAQGETSQETEQKQLSKGHSPTGDDRGRDKLGHEIERKRQRKGHSQTGDHR